MSISLEPSCRPLTPAELRLLRVKARSLKARARRASIGYLPVSVGIFLALWAITVLASNESVLVTTFFWGVVGVLITLWIQKDARKDAKQFEAMAHGLESAIRRNAAQVYDIRARSFVEFEEIGDEGACYAFELEGGRVVFVAGQEFYRAAKFPSLDFSLVHPLDEADRPADAWIEKRAKGAQPKLVFAAEEKRRLNMPGHLDVLSSDIHQLKTLLSSAF